MFAVGQVDQPYKLYEGYPWMEIKLSTDILDDIPITVVVPTCSKM